MVLVSDKPSNAISILQTKLRDRERHEARCGGPSALPLDQHIEERHREREPCLKIRPLAVHDFLEVADERQHRQDRLYQHAIFPRAPLTEFQVGGIALGGMEGGITQDNHPPINLLHQLLKGVNHAWASMRSCTLNLRIIPIAQKPDKMVSFPDLVRRPYHATTPR